MGNIAAFMTKTLQAVIVGNALSSNLRQALVQCLTVRRQLGQAQGKAVGRMRAALQFAGMPNLFEDAQAGAFSGAQIRISLAWQVQAEPLDAQIPFISSLIK